ncbi:hypothetical protein LTR56_017431 [Elasticomyces elasticus]|nr:hypothetical protein LTR56_017431 [Elasticomyces elasticus]KAK3647919.1 hypothetical protein LTR22_013532 [Elasticomyces elasticus]KAK4922410.1 hypothetical protein LTR49_010275 [Elasticomyces elasticus]KAK5765292.1 hypothetical protein LTS12_004549 [Elasticomyces elasticus]
MTAFITSKASHPDVDVREIPHEHGLPSIGQDPRALRAFAGSDELTLKSSETHTPLGRDSHGLRRSADEVSHLDNNYMQHGHFPRIHTPISWLVGSARNDDGDHSRTGEPGDSAKDWNRDWETHAFDQPAVARQTGPPKVESIGVLPSCPECAAAAEDEDAMAEDWRKVNEPQLSGFHLLDHREASADGLDAPVEDDAVARDSDAHVARLKLERCLTHEMVPDRRRRSFFDVFQHLRRGSSYDEADLEHASSNKDVDLPQAVELSDAAETMPKPVAEVGAVDAGKGPLKRRASLTEAFKARYHPYRHHSWKLSSPTTPIDIAQHVGETGAGQTTSAITDEFGATTPVTHRQ